MTEFSYLVNLCFDLNRSEPVKWFGISTSVLFHVHRLTEIYWSQFHAINSALAQRFLLWIMERPVGVVKNVRSAPNLRSETSKQFVFLNGFRGRARVLNVIVKKNLNYSNFVCFDVSSNRNSSRRYSSNKRQSDSKGDPRPIVLPLKSD